MIDTNLIEIIEQCLMLDNAAKEIYISLSKNTKDVPIMELWQELAEDEKQHVVYWEQLLAQVNKQEVPNVFDNPKKIKKVLKELKTKIDKISMRAKNISKIVPSFILAYQLEFYLLHPAFAALFHLMKKHTDNKSPEDDYEAHINKIINAMIELDHVTPEFQLFAQFVQRIWNDNRQLAKRIGDIQTIDGLIPICTNCKKVINYEGYWETVEYYIKKHLDESFTHWICPECMETLYQ
jgi:rubrerythrin